MTQIRSVWICVIVLAAADAAAQVDAPVNGPEPPTQDARVLGEGKNTEDDLRIDTVEVNNDPDAPNEKKMEDVAGRVQVVLAKHCFRCHGKEGDPEGDIALTGLSSASAFLTRPELLRDMIDAIESEAMPPEEESQMDEATRTSLIGDLGLMFRKSVDETRAFPVTPIRRMNRFQYGNAIQDLFELNVDVFALPERMLRSYGYFDPASGVMPETLKAGSRPLGKSQLIAKRLAGVAPFPQDLRAEHGFDNRADHLSLSPLLLESFFRLSRSIVNSPDFNPKTCGIWPAFFAPPESTEDSASEIDDRLQRFLTRAFRRPVEADVLRRYANHATTRIEAGDSFTDAMKSTASAVIASPKFLYLYSRDSDSRGKNEIEDDFELATRLSFFLWGSIPDQTLIELAAAGSLRERQVLSEQVDRMLNDKRVKRFCDSFPSQWLQLERIIASVPDRELHPKFYFAKFRVSMHMMLEPLLLFETILVEDRSIIELIDSDYSYRSELLTSWYRDGTQSNRVPPTAIPFRRVSISDRRQGGVLTCAAVMTMTSGPTRTQPITRGAWIASVLFHDPPEPPPADVPPLPSETPESDQDLTLRERFASHRSRPECAACHVKIDPLGFALENFGPTGVWREKYDNGRDVDCSGVLFAKHKFSDVVEFKDAILKEKGRFVRAFASHLLSFSLGREVALADWNSIEEIAQEASANDYRMRELIRSIVLSDPFVGRRR